MQGIVLDVDGVIWINGAPGEGSFKFIRALGQHEIPFCMLTNDCSVGNETRRQTLVRAGFDLRPERLVTAGDVTNSFLRREGFKKIIYLGAPDALQDVSKGMEVCDQGEVDSVIVGDVFDSYDRRELEAAAKAVWRGAALVAMQRNARWSDGRTWHIDNGFWVAGLEYVVGRKAILAGKPSAHSYRYAISRLGFKTADAPKIGFVSDDLAGDLRGAKEAGLTTVYFGPDAGLPTWVDFSVQDTRELLPLLLGSTTND